MKWWYFWILCFHFHFALRCTLSTMSWQYLVRNVCIHRYATQSEWLPEWRDDFNLFFVNSCNPLHTFSYFAAGSLHAGRIEAALIHPSSGFLKKVKFSSIILKVVWRRISHFWLHYDNEFVRNQLCELCISVLHDFVLLAHSSWNSGLSGHSTIKVAFIGYYNNGSQIRGEILKIKQHNPSELTSVWHKLLHVMCFYCRSW